MNDLETGVDVYPVIPQDWFKTQLLQDPTPDFELAQEVVQPRTPDETNC